MTLPELIENPPIVHLRDLYRMTERGVFGGHSGDLQIGPFQTEEEINESDQRYFYRETDKIIMNPTSTLIFLIVISGAFSRVTNCDRGVYGIHGGGGRFGGEGYIDYKNQTCTENSITCSDDRSETCPDGSTKPALTLA